MTGVAPLNVSGRGLGWTAMWWNPSPGRLLHHEVHSNLEPGTLPRLNSWDSLPTAQNVPREPCCHLL